MVASRVQTTHLLSVTPAFPIPPRGADSSSEESARRIWASSVATRLRYDRSSVLIADRILWPSSPPAGDFTKSLRPRYNSDGSARVCKSDIMGGGRVGGSLSVFSLEKGKVVDDSPCSVKGKSLRSADSGGSISTELTARRVDLRETFLASFLISVPEDWLGDAFSSSGPCRALSGGNLLNPPGANASLITSSCCDDGAGVDALDCLPDLSSRSVRSCLSALSFPCCRCAASRATEWLDGEGLAGLMGCGSLGSGESDSWYSRYRIAHFWFKTGSDSRRV